MAQRLVRAKQKIRDARIPYRVPLQQELAQRLEAVLLVVYLVFNEGYSATSGDTAIRHELCAEAIRLGWILCQLLPSQTEARALCSLSCCCTIRAAKPASPKNGEPVLLEEQNRDAWNQEQISRGPGPG
jgi:RNA polymerase sigma-70 factor, ECF subfamily